jgi:flagellar motor switch protein FliM
MGSPSGAQTPVPVPVPVPEPLPVPESINPKSKPFASAENSTAQNLAKATWEAYRSAFASRWGADPVRNARINSQVKQVVAALGANAPDVAAYFVSHNDRFYVAKRHPVGCLLKDAEGLHTQWYTGVKSTALEAKSAEQRDSVREQVERVMRKLENKA